jgi:hypothetical protein
MNLVEPRTQAYADLLNEIDLVEDPTTELVAMIGAVCNLTDTTLCQDVSNWTWVSDDTPVTFNQIAFEGSAEWVSVDGPMFAILYRRISDNTNYWLQADQNHNWTTWVMCEMGDHWNRPPPPPPTATCVGGQEQQVGDYKFCVADEGKSFDEAGQFCADNNSNLVSPHSVSIDHAIKDLCNDDEFCWINL